MLEIWRLRIHFEDNFGQISEKNNNNNNNKKNQNVKLNEIITEHVKR